jgi:hypothetical protein
MLILFLLVFFLEHLTLADSIGSEQKSRPFDNRGDSESHIEVESDNSQAECTSEYFLYLGREARLKSLSIVQVEHRTHKGNVRGSEENQGQVYLESKDPNDFSVRK